MVLCINETLFHCICGCLQRRLRDAVKRTHIQDAINVKVDCNHAFDQAFRELYTAHYTGKTNYAVSKPLIARATYGPNAWMSLPKAQLPTALPGQVTVMVINPRT